MQYDLMIFKDMGNDYVVVKDFVKIPGFDHLNPSELKDLVKFTHMFSCETELIHFLISEELMPDDYIYGSAYLGSHRKKDAEPEVLPNGVSYADEAKFYSINFLKEYFLNHKTTPDFMEPFIKQYCAKVKYNPTLSSHMSHIRFCFEFYSSYGYHFQERFGESERNMENSITGFVYGYCRKRDKNNNYVDNFIKIRELAMFVINYERNLALTKSERKSPEETTNEPEISELEIKLLIKHYKTILQNVCSEEERAIYEQEIDKLEKMLSTKLSLKINRS